MEPLSVPRILYHTLRIPARSPKPSAALLLAFLAAYALLYTSNLYVLLHDVRPLLPLFLRDLLLLRDSFEASTADLSAATAAAERDVVAAEHAASRELAFWAASFLLSAVGWTVFVHFAEITRLGKAAGTRELLARARRSAVGTLATCLLASLLVLLYAVALLVPAVMLADVLLRRHARTLLRLALAAFAPLALGSLLFLSALADLARVVAVLEGWCGAAAFAEAWGVLRERRMQGLLLAAALEATAAVAEVALAAAEGGAAGSVVAYVVGGYVRVAVMGAVTVFSMMAFTVFYLDCKRCRGERMGSIGVELQFESLVSSSESEEEEGSLP